MGAGTSPPGPSSGIDGPRVRAAIRELLLAIGEDPDRAGLKQTPARVARSYEEIFSGMRREAAEVLDPVFTEDYDEVVLVRDIPVFSLCEHHLLPWHGSAAVGYLPNETGTITGLSKLARLVDVFARRLQVQERFTTQIADALDAALAPRGVVVVVEAEHLCMSMRGVRTPAARTVTSAVRGSFRDSAASRAEALALVRSGR